MSLKSGSRATRRVIVTCLLLTLGLLPAAVSTAVADEIPANISRTASWAIGSKLALAAVNYAQGGDPGARLQEVRSIAEGLRQRFREAVEAIGANPFLRYGPELHVHLTGGGAQLPFVMALTEEPIVVAGRSLRIVRHVEPPDWIGKTGAEWVKHFAQLAVVIGAPLPGLPEGVEPYLPGSLKPSGRQPPKAGGAEQNRPAARGTR